MASCDAETIRIGEASDASLLGLLLHEFNVEFAETEPRAEQIASLAREQLESGEIDVLFAGHEPVGFAQLRFHTSLYAPGPDACLEELWVRREHRGTGTGRALLDAAMQRARERGATRISLNTSMGDHAARSLYESAGFTNEEGGPGGPSMLYYERDL